MQQRGRLQRVVLLEDIETTGFSRCRHEITVIGTVVSSSSVACSEVGMFSEECVDEPFGRARPPPPATCLCCQSNSFRASVFARVYSIAAYLSFMSAAAPGVLCLAFWQSLRLVVSSRQKMFDRTNVGV